ncbi:hypothetical protein TNCV_4335871 [Trichonephila clavipes]|nr:hypothetical protein TNCV_4335871 [Trichonephila clavipes]
MLGNEIVSALIDTGSRVSLIREDVSSKIVHHSILSKINTVLYGLGKTEVITKGSFEYDFVLDRDQYSLTWHVVPTKQLNFEAIIGADILEQDSFNFTQDGVMFHKHEEKAWLMQISGLHPEDELDFSHILESQVKIDLTRYASPLVIVKKKNGDSRLWVDYRQLNRKLVKDRFPLPLIDDVLDRLQEVKIYTTLDLKNGFFHLDVNEDCRNFTSFIVPDGQFEFNKVPFSLSTSPSVFQRYIYSIYRNLMNEGLIIIYMDDLLISSADEEEGLRKLRTVFEVA